MKNRRRNRIDIIISILETVESEGGKSKPTHILCRANLSHKLMKNYLTELISKGFIAENHNERKIVITKKGAEFLSELRKMKMFIESFGL